MSSTSKSLRQQLLQARQALTTEQQNQHAKQATHQLLRSPWLQRPKHIAVFFSQKGELPTDKLIQALWQRGHYVYLPVLTSLKARKNQPMAFAPYLPNSRMTDSKYGIPEPLCPHQYHRFGKQLQIVITPLVGFDEMGHRLGMGGGFYDRTFAFKKHLPINSPKLIGWAHECQKLPQLTPQPWDIPLDATVTEKQIYHHP